MNLNISLSTKIVRAVPAFGPVCLAPIQPALAQSQWDLSANVTLATEWIDRGLSQTNGQAVIQGGVTLSHEGGFYVDVWASPIDYGFGDPTDAEIDYGIGYAGATEAGLNYDVSFYYETFPGAPSDANEYWEMITALDYDLGWAAWSAIGYITTKGPGATTYVSTGLSVPVADQFSLEGHFGRAGNKSTVGDDYWDWNVGVVYTAPWFDLALRYYDVENRACVAACKSHIVMSVSREF